ncbi:MAG: hypothetical protein CMJ86_10460 [Planctomycetes bacterium]|nr:hypothetical protein [Planctomycetota bacterium]
MGNMSVIICLLLSFSGSGGTPSMGHPDPARVQQPGPSAPLTSHEKRQPTKLLTVDEALALCFPKCKTTRGTKFLSPTEVKQIARLSGSKDISRIAHPYQAHDSQGALVGTAWFDTHRVRSKRETLMIAIDPQGKILRIEVLAFAEPRQYRPPAKWYGQFKGERLSPKLTPKGNIKTMAGATLTTRATVQSARRALALQQVLDARNPKPSPVGATK